MAREKAIVARILGEFRKRGGVAEKIHGSEYMRTGIADILACFRGWYIAVEVKRPGMKASPAQEAFLEEVRAAGGWGVVCDSSAEIARALDVFPRVCRSCFVPLVESPPTGIGRNNQHRQMWACPNKHGVLIDGSEFVFFGRGRSPSDQGAETGS